MEKTEPPPSRPVDVKHIDVRRIGPSGWERVLDIVAEEAPLAIRIAHSFKDVRLTEDFAVTMRTPGHDRELVAGLLLAEAIIQNAEDLTGLRALGSAESNEILAELSPSVDFEGWRAARKSFVNSSCGVCGKRSREAIAQAHPAAPDDRFRVAA